MIKIFNANDISFSSNGEIVINPLKLIEIKKKSLNGWYIEVEVPIEYKEYIKQDNLCVVKTKSKLKPQAFRINNPEYEKRKISFTANHVMFDAKNYFLEDVRPTNQNGLNTLKYINERTDKTSPFTILYSDVEKVDTFYFIRKNLLEAWETIEESFGGIFDADNFDISFKTSIGVDRGEVIAYGKNLQNIKIYEDWSNVCTRLYPVGKDGLLLESKYIDSSIQYDKPYTKTVSFETELDEENQTKENLLNELLVKANEYLVKNKTPQVSYEITSDINQLVEIGDKIHVKHPLVNILTEVLEYEFNGITKKVKKLIFGNYTRDVKSKFDSIKSSIETVKSEISSQSKIINDQTNLINSLNKNGYVYIDDNEILILDQLPKENAKNVWRFGLGGIGFSSTGYKGPFGIAMTGDGKINADFISTGTLSASRIEGYNELLLNVDKIVNLEREVNNKNYLYIENAMKGQLEYLEINGSFSLNCTDDESCSEDIYLIIDKTMDLSSDAKKIQLPISSLENDDRFIIENGKTRIEKSDGTIENYEDIDIELFDGENYLYLESFQDNDINFYAKYIIKNDYTEKLVSKLEMNNLIKQTNERTDIELSKKVGNNEVIAKINMSTEKDSEGSFIGINADKLDLKGKEFNLTSDDINIVSNNLSIDKEGILTCKKGIMNDVVIENGQINLTGDSNAQFINIYSTDKSKKSEMSYWEYRIDYNGDDLVFLYGKGSGPNGDNNISGHLELYGPSSDIVLFNAFPSEDTITSTIMLNGENGYISCYSLSQKSLVNLKKNFEKLNNAIEIIKNADVYKYNFNFENDTDKKHIGLIIGEGYNTPEEVISKDGNSIDTYSLIGLCLKAIQEQQEEIEKLKGMIQ